MRSVNARAVANAAKPQVSVLREAAADAQRVRLPQMAAALTFRTIFGLVPVLVVALVLLKYFTSGDQIQRLLRAFVDRMGLGNIVLGQDADPAFVGPLPPTRLDDWVTDFVSRVEQINFAAIGLVSVLMLIYGAVAMVVEVETAFNQVYRVPRGRSWSRRLTNYWTLLTLGPLGLFATLYAGQRVPYWLDSGSMYLIEHFPRLVSGVGGEGTLETARAAIEGLAYLAQFVISAGLLLVVYQVVPNTKVKLWPALTGAVLAASLFEASKFGFAQYVRFTASESYARLYGSIGLLPLFLLWVYFTWIIVLFGLQVSYQLQHGRGKTRAQPMLDAGPSIVEPTAGVVAMTALARAFDAGGTLDAPAIAKASGLSDGVVRLVTARLAERGLVHRLESGPDVEPSYTLARPPATIRVAELLEIGFELASSDTGSATAALCEKLRRAQIQAAGDETLASAAGLPAPTGPSTGTIPLEPAKA